MARLASGALSPPPLIPLADLPPPADPGRAESTATDPAADLPPPLIPAALSPPH